MKVLVQDSHQNAIGNYDQHFRLYFPQYVTDRNIRYYQENLFYLPREASLSFMDYITIRENPPQFLSLTSLEVSEFSWLLGHFTPRWESYYRYHTLEGKKRKIVSYHEHGNSLLKGTDQKLFFLLVYLKTNSLQQHQAASFGISQSKVSQIVRILLAVLDQTLHELKLSPGRNGEDLQRSLANHASKVFTYDGIERGIARNSDSHAQEEEFSGKKKVTA